MLRSLVIIVCAAACAPVVDSPNVLPVVASSPPLAQVAWGRLGAPSWHSRHDLVRVPVTGGDRLYSTWTAPYVSGPRPAIVEVVMLPNGDVQYRPTPIVLPSEGRALAAGDLRGDGTTQLVLRTEDRLMIVDPRTWAVRSDVPLTLATISQNAQLALHDLNGDGQLEVLVRGDDEIAVVTPTGQVLGMVDLRGADSGPWVAEVDGSPGLEIVLPESGTWLNAATLQVEGTAAGCDGIPYDLVDVDGDGMQEVLWMDDGTLGALDLVSGATRWVSPGGPWYSDVPDAVAAVDMEGDGSLELLVPRDHPDRARMEVLDAATGTWLRDLEMSHQWAELAASVPVDLDGDGVDELAWSGPTGVEILDLATSTWLSATPLLDSNGTSFSFGDIDGDGSREIVLGSGHYWNEIAVLDATTRQLVSYGMLDHSYDLEQPTPRRLLDADGDGVDELLLTMVGGDAILARLSRTGPPVTIGVSTNKIYGTFQNLFVVDVDADGDDEVLTAATSGPLRLWDPSGHVSDWGVSGGPNAGIAIGDLLGTGEQQVVRARTNGPMEVRALRTGALLVTGPANYQEVLVEGPGVLWCFAQTAAGVYQLDRFTHAGGVFSLDRSITVTRPEMRSMRTVQWIDGRIWLLGDGVSVVVNPTTGAQEQLLQSSWYGAPVELQQVGGVVLVPDAMGWRAVRTR